VYSIINSITYLNQKARQFYNTCMCYNLISNLLIRNIMMFELYIQATARTVVTVDVYYSFGE